MVKLRKLVPTGKNRESAIYRIRRISNRELNARERELLRAGYLKKEEYAGRDWPSEISRLDNDYEAGLKSLTLKELRKLQILSGRRNHIRNIMDSERVDREAAKRLARRDLFEWGAKVGNASDYIEYYYNRYH